jgi:nitroimidazol reductase NimA-like FMN-containing flavoprotein (pyridoxamine 5'-phosphate oxidase superfamily)
MRTIIIESREEIDQIIRSCKTCFVSLCENNIPYVVPMNFALDNDVVILHMAKSGRKWDILTHNPQVCINWISGEKIAWQDEEVGCSYRVKSKSVIVEGTAEFIEDHQEKMDCMQKFMAQYSAMTFKFNAPSIKNVGVVKIRILAISAKKFGTKVIMPWNKNDSSDDDE